MMIKYYDITENELNSKAFEAGSVYFCYDTLRIYYDSISDNKRIDISEFAVVLDTENERDGLLSPIPNKLYYIKENNKLYIYLNSEWFAINDPTTLAQLGITVSATEINRLSGVSSNVQDQIDIKAPKKLICTNTTQTGSDTYTCSHSFSEIKECHDNGGCVELHFIDGGMTHPYIFNITDISDNAIIFSYRGYAKLIGPGISLTENTITMNSNDYYTLIRSIDNNYYIEDKIDAKAPKKLICTAINPSGTYTCDHTFSEIKECHDNGGCVELHINRNNALLVLNVREADDDKIVFEYNGYTLFYNNKVLYSTKFTMLADSTLTESDTIYYGVENRINAKAPKKIICTVTSSNGTYTCSHSFSEIKECHDNGGCVELHFRFDSTTYRCIYDIYDINDTTIVFAYYGYNFLYGGSAPVLLRHIFTMTSDAPTTLIASHKDSYYIPSLPLIESKGGTGCTSIVDTTYTIARYRASALVSRETTPTQNGVINWVYE